MMNSSMSNSSFTNKVFGTLPKQYCLWFYILCVIAFIGLIFSIFGFFYLFTVKHSNSLFFIQSLMLIINYLFIYLTNRLLYSMCISSLK
jgi:hypothetical protein